MTSIQSVRDMQRLVEEWLRWVDNGLLDWLKIDIEDWLSGKKGLALEWRLIGNR